MKAILTLIAAFIALPAFAEDPSANCFNNLENHSVLAPLRNVIALGNIKAQTMEMMTSTRHPTVMEKALIKAWVKERDQCYVMGEGWRIDHMPSEMRSILDTYYAKNKLLIANLYAAELTFGEFATKRAALSSELNTELNAAIRANQGKRNSASPVEPEKEKERAASRAAFLEAAAKILDSSPLQTGAQ